MKWLLVAGLLVVTGNVQAAEVQEVVSPKGITAWLVEDHSLPVVAVRMAFRDGGTASDPQDKQGQAFMAAAMVTRGAGELDEEAFTSELEERAITLDAGVSEDSFTISLLTLSQHRDRAFTLLGMALNTPRLDDDAFERRRRAFISAFTRRSSNPNFLIDSAWRKAAFPDHVYGRPADGTIEGIRALRKQDVKTFLTQHLAKEVMIIGVAGDITPEELAPLLDAALADLPEKAQLPVIADAVPHKGGAVAVEHAIPQTLVTMVAPGVSRTAPEFFPAYVLNYLLGGGGLTSRLAVEVREKHGLAYYANSDLLPMKHAALLLAQFATRHDEAVRAIELAQAVMKTLYEQGVDAQELDDAKRFITGSFPLQLDNNGQLANYLVTMQFYGLGRDYLDKREEYVNAVTKAEVDAVAKQLLDPTRLLTVTVGKKH